MVSQLVYGWVELDWSRGNRTLFLLGGPDTARFTLVGST